MNRFLALAGIIAVLLGIPTQSHASAEVAVVFTPDEVSIITSWYRDHGSGTGNHSKARGKKNGGLPPGILKNLARGKSLPPGIAKQALPAGLASILPAPPKGYERVVVGGRVLLVEIATQVIHDVLVDLVFD